MDPSARLLDVVALALDERANAVLFLEGTERHPQRYTYIEDEHDHDRDDSDDGARPPARNMLLPEGALPMHRPLRLLQQLLLVVASILGASLQDGLEVVAQRPRVRPRSGT